MTESQMPQIPKEQIKQVIEDQTSFYTGEISATVIMLQGLLDQPENKPLDIDAIAVNLMRFTGIDKHKARSITKLYINRSTPFTPVTADDITDDMIANFIRGHTDNMTYQKTFIAAVNAYMKGK
jgi:hypothetical protein